METTPVVKGRTSGGTSEKESRLYGKKVFSSVFITWLGLGFGSGAGAGSGSGLGSGLGLGLRLRVGGLGSGSG